MVTISDSFPHNIFFYIRACEQNPLQLAHLIAAHLHKMTFLKCVILLDTLTSHHKVSLKADDSRFLCHSKSLYVWMVMTNTMMSPVQLKKTVKNPHALIYCVHFMSILIPLLSGSWKTFFTWESFAPALVLQWGCGAGSEHGSHDKGTLSQYRPHSRGQDLRTNRPAKTQHWPAWQWALQSPQRRDKE